MSSGVVKSPDITMELLYQTLYKLRTEYHFQGYIHVKAIPGSISGADREGGISGRPYECESGTAYGGRTESTGSSEEACRHAGTDSAGTDHADG